MSIAPDYTNATNHLKQVDPVLARLIDSGEPCLLGASQITDSAMSGLIKAIFYQSISLKAATTVFNRFLNLYPGQGFPVPQTILDTPDQSLREIGLPPFKVQYIKAVAQQAIEGLLTLQELDRLSNEAIIKELTAIKGVGVWTVQMLLIFQLKRLDVLPVSDLGLRAAIQDLYELDALPDKTTVEAIGQPWKPYRTIATWHLWQSRGNVARELLKLWS
ncbi:MAG: DNA-3-methyladenine glycosylase [Elainellaceae cyanobacterium]